MTLNHPLYPFNHKNIQEGYNNPPETHTPVRQSPLYTLANYESGIPKSSLLLKVAGTRVCSRHKFGDSQGFNAWSTHKLFPLVLGAPNPIPSMGIYYLHEWLIL